MGMFIEVILIVFRGAVLRADAASGMTDVARRFLRAFKLVSESLIGRICHCEFASLAHGAQVKERIEKHPDDVNEVPV